MPSCAAERWAPGAERYLQDCIEVFEENGWSWAYHALNDWSGWSLEFDESYWIDALGCYASAPSELKCQQRSELQALRQSALICEICG